MPVKTVYHSACQRHVKLGRKRPIARGLRLSLSDYLQPGFIPQHPDACDFRKPALQSLYHLFLNDQLGDCVIAAGYHIVGVETGNAGDLFIPSYPQIVKDYSAIGGYVPGNPDTDQGCSEQDALNYWCDNGFANGTKPIGWLTVDGTNKEEVQAAQYLFENLFFGVELPDKWVDPMPSGGGFKWDVAGRPNPNNGHAFMGLGYNPAGVIIDTWGMMGTITWKAIAKYATAASYGDLYSILTPDQIMKGETKAPNGVLWNNLIGDFKKLGGYLHV